MVVELLLALCLKYPQWECDPGFTAMKNMPTTYDTAIQEAVAEFLPDYDWRLFKAQLWQESRLVPNRMSSKGAQGVAQIMPATWKEWAPKTGYDTTKVTPWNANAAIRVAANYMSYQINNWHWPRPAMDRHCLALASYNAGFGSLLDAQKLAGNPYLYYKIIASLPDVTGEKNSKETIEYVQKILFFYNELVTG